MNYKPSPLFHKLYFWYSKLFLSLLSFFVTVSFCWRAAEMPRDLIPGKGGVGIDPNPRALRSFTW